MTYKTGAPEVEQTHVIERTLSKGVGNTIILYAIIHSDYNNSNLINNLKNCVSSH